MSKSTLALDLGTDTGYAVDDGFGKLSVGAWKLGSARAITEWGKTRMTRRCDPRVLLLYRSLCRMFPEIVIFEDVQFASSTYQVQLWSSLRAAIWCAYGARSNVTIECVPTGTLKKFATGDGRATKEMMAAALYRLWPERKSDNLSDDAIDALWLWHWAAKHLAQV